MALFSHIRVALASLAMTGMAIAHHPAMAEKAKLAAQFSASGGQHSEWDYATYMGGLRIVDFHLSATVAGGNYRLEGVGETRGLADLLARRVMRVDSQGSLATSGAVQPQIHRRVSQRRGDERRVTLRFNGALQSVEAEPAYDDAEIPPHAVTAAPGIVDPMSALLAVLLSPAQAAPCQMAVHSFDGKRLYAITGTGGVDDRLETSDYNAYAGPALRCPIEITQLEAPTTDQNTASSWLKIDPDKDFATTHATVWLVPGGPGGTYVAVRAELVTESGFQALVHLQSPVEGHVLSAAQTAQRQPLVDAAQ
jgi:hypothetical protein